VIREQKVDMLEAENPDRVDPYLFSVWARIKKEEDMDSVRDDILATLAAFRQDAVPAERLEAVKSHLRYRFALGMDNSQSIAAMLARYVALRRTPETINRVHELYSQVTPEDVRAAARKYLTDNGRTIVTLRGAKSR